ncbi:MAG: Methyltransferase protein [Parcubacteria group bacterium Gr01-1014_91]|nr:MAG: Methyltransferase protein [Parcubacteria group bacterium Gr01-1014_91]
MNEPRATDFRQYDTPELDWRIRGAEDWPSRVFFRNELDSVTSADTFRGKRVVDIGSGVGQLFNWLQTRGVSKIVGVEPSERNVQASKELHPSITVVQSTLDSFTKTNHEPFDIAMVLMVFEHIQDVGGAFRDIGSILVDDGTCYVIIGDNDYNIALSKMPREETRVSVEVVREFEDGSVETKIVWGEGGETQTTMHDIFHPAELVLRLARENGFALVHQKTLLDATRTSPELKNIPMFHLLVFQKK